MRFQIDGSPSSRNRFRWPRYRWKAEFSHFQTKSIFFMKYYFFVWNFSFFKEMLKNSKSFPTLKIFEILKNHKNISKSVFEQRYNPLRSYLSNNLVVCKKLGLRVQFENFRFLRTFSRWWKSLLQAASPRSRELPAQARPRPSPSSYPLGKCVKVHPQTWNFGNFNSGDCLLDGLAPGRSEISWISTNFSSLGLKMRKLIENRFPTIF